MGKTKFETAKGARVFRLAFIVEGGIVGSLYAFFLTPSSSLLVGGC